MPPQADGELCDGELQTQGEQEQHHADRGSGGNEPSCVGDRCDAALAHKQSGQQVERNGREPVATRGRAKDGQGDQDPAEFEQEARGDFHGLPVRSGASDAVDQTPDSGDSVIGTDHHQNVVGTQQLPGSRRGQHPSVRTIATMEAPVRVRAWVSPSGRPA